MKKKPARRARPAVTNVEIAVLFAHFSLLINAGYRVLDVLKTMAIESKNPSLNHALVKMHDGCQAGKNLSEQMRQFPEIFSPTMVNMVSTGEVGGTLDTHLELLAKFTQSIVSIEKGA